MLAYDSLGSRQKDYEQVHDYVMMRRVPVVCRVDGIGFSRLCRKIKKPYNQLFLEAMAKTMLGVVQNIPGAVFAYQQSDEITFIIKNDQSLESVPWYENRLQKINAAIASKTTRIFNEYINDIEQEIELVGDAEFAAVTFTLPTISEAVNNLIWRQQDCTRNAISGTAQSLFFRKFGKKAGLKLLHGQSSQTKLKLMKTECDIDFEEEFPNCFRMGVGAYKVPMILSNKNGEDFTKKKWIIDWDLSNFVTSKESIYNILVSGQDVFRENRIVTSK